MPSFYLYPSVAPRREEVLQKTSRFWRLWYKASLETRVAGDTWQYLARDQGIEVTARSSLCLLPP